MKLNINTNSKMEGKISLRVIKNGKEVLTHTQNNIFLNNFNDRPAMTIGTNLYLQLGTDNSTPPDPQQEGLINLKAERGMGKPPLVWAQDIANGYTYFSKTVLFPIGEATGNISEIGLRTTESSSFYGDRWGDTTSKTITRALIADSNGDPIVIPVDSDQELEVTYEIRYVKTGPFTPFTDSFIFNETPINYTVYPVNYWQTNGSSNRCAYWNQSMWGFHWAGHPSSAMSPSSITLLYDIQNKAPTISELNPESNADVNLNNILNYSDLTGHGNFSYSDVDKAGLLSLELSALSSGTRNVSGFVIRSRSSGTTTSSNNFNGVLVIFETDLTIPELFKFNFELAIDSPKLV